MAKPPRNSKINLLIADLQNKFGCGQLSDYRQMTIGMLPVPALDLSTIFSRYAAADLVIIACAKGIVIEILLFDP